jgi:hypothetical protein
MSDGMLLALYFDALLFVIASCLAMFRLYSWLNHNQIHRTNRARTCGTCAYCEQQKPTHPDGVCCRHAYQRNPMCVNDEAVRNIVQLDWRGCGESEERT